jgi:hypothetical protein
MLCIVSGVWKTFFKRVCQFENKIKEDTGSEPTKIALSSPPQKIIHGSGSRGRHSRQGSGSSLGSLSPDGVREGLVSSSTLLKRQDSSKIQLADGKVRIFLAIKLINPISLDVRK